MAEQNETEALIKKEQKRVEKENKKEAKKRKKEEKNRLKLEKRTPKQMIRRKMVLESIYTILMVIAVISAYIAINVGAKVLDLSDIDLTKQKFYSLSKETKSQLDKIDKEIQIYIFGYKEESAVVDLAKQYSKYNNKITIETTSIEKRPDIADEYNITSEDETSGTILMICEGRNITINYFDFYTYDYNTYEYIDLTEQKITNSILAVTLEEAPKIYFLTGHGEYTTSDYLTILGEELEREINEIEKLDLLVKNEVPEDCETLIIYNPSTDFTDFETELIIKYINKGGNILWLSDYSLSGTLTNAQKILDLYGVSTSNDGIILEQDDTAILMKEADFISPQINTEADITAEIATSGKVALLDSGKIDIKSEAELQERNVIIVELLKSSENAFYRKDLSISSANPIEGEEIKSFTLGALAIKTISSETENLEEKDNVEEITSKLVIFTNAIFGTDYARNIQNQKIPLINLYNNRDILMNSISYLTERKETISIRKTYISVPYTATQQEDLIVRAIIFILPLVIIAVGFGVWIARRRKK